ncbi:hypothetical protein CEB3_c28550 [Peptococcaceae bacterium CEB3]|nr:hypothetical protein CEB3_c28550 [Peptococcaceae bacterium CEB3]
MSANQAKQEEWQPLKIGRFSCQHVLVVLMGWLVIYGLGSIFVSNPFWTETSAGADINYAHTMYLHGLLISLVGLVALAACQVFLIRSKHVRHSILGAVTAAVILATIGGIFDTHVEASFWLWIQIFSFFALDDILISLLIGFYLEWKNKSTSSRSLPFWSAMLGTVGLFLAAVMGHLAGWILEFGDFPHLIGAYARLVGEKTGDLMGNLIGSHSHLMIVALLSVLVAMSAWRFGYQALQGGPRLLARVGFWFVIVGTGVITVVYLLAGFTWIQPPTWFQSGPGGINGIASDDVISGVGIMLGGLLVLLGMILNKKGVDAKPGWLKPALVAVGTSWISLVFMVVGGGFGIELNTNIFGAGDPKAPLAAGDAVFTFLHQDYAFFLLPAVMILLLIADVYLKKSHVKTIARGMSLGVFVALVGGFVHVFLDPMVAYGAGYFLVGIGIIVIVGTTLLLIGSLRKVADVEEKEVLLSVPEAQTSRA